MMIDRASEVDTTSKPKSRPWKIALGVAGVLFGLVAFYFAEGWTSGFFYLIGGLCFAVGRYLSYMEHAVPD
jgi:hypothetical protein